MTRHDDQFEVWTRRPETAKNLQRSFLLWGLSAPRDKNDVVVSDLRKFAQPLRLRVLTIRLRAVEFDRSRRDDALRTRRERSKVSRGDFILRGDERDSAEGRRERAPRQTVAFEGTIANSPVDDRDANPLATRKAYEIGP